MQVARMDVASILDSEFILAEGEYLLKWRRH